MTKRPPVAARGKDEPKGLAMPALLQHENNHQSDQYPLPGTARFSGDWVDASVVLGHGTIRVDTADQGHILIPEDFETLCEALDMSVSGHPPRPWPGTGRTATQFNAVLGMLLVPGGHDRVGRSFFPLRPAGAPTR